MNAVMTLITPSHATLISQKMGFGKAKTKGKSTFFCNASRLEFPPFRLYDALTRQLLAHRADGLPDLLFLKGRP